MTGAFAYLSICSVKNRFLARLRRLRQPRYLAGFVVGVAYFYTMYFRRLHVSLGGPRDLVGRAGAPLELLGSLFLFVLVALAWAWPRSGAIAFTRSEIQFLFQAPLTRRQLIWYKLLRSQIATFISSAILTVFLRPSLAHTWTIALGLWLAMATLGVHLMGVSLRARSLIEHGVSGLRRAWLPLALIAAVVVAVTTAIAGDWPVLSSATGAGEVLRELDRVLGTGAAGVAMWPFRAVAHLPLSPTPAAFGRALWPVLVILGGSLVWTVRSDARFEEASAEAAESRLARLQERRARPRAPRKAGGTPFALAPTGRPEFAILWKNLIWTGRFFSVRMLIRLLALAVVAGIAARRVGGHREVAQIVGFFCLGAVAFIALIGPQMTRGDLRRDLAHLAVLKTWPVRGAVLLRGELLAPAAILTGLAWLMTVAGVALVGQLSLGGQWWSFGTLTLGVAIAGMAPGFILAQLVVQNGAAVMFPAWVNVNARGVRPGSVESTGQQMLVLTATLLAVVVALVPAAIATAALLGLVYLVTHTVSVALGGVALGAALVVECAAAVELIGAVLDRTDVGDLDAVE